MRDVLELPSQLVNEAQFVPGARLEWLRGVSEVRRGLKQGAVAWSQKCRLAQAQAQCCPWQASLRAITAALLLDSTVSPTTQAAAGSSGLFCTGIDAVSLCVQDGKQRSKGATPLRRR